MTHAETFVLTFHGRKLSVVYGCKAGCCWDILSQTCQRKRSLSCSTQQVSVGVRTELTKTVGPSVLNSRRWSLFVSVCVHVVPWPGYKTQQRSFECTVKPCPDPWPHDRKQQQQNHPFPSSTFCPPIMRLNILAQNVNHWASICGFWDILTCASICFYEIMSYK